MPMNNADRDWVGTQIATAVQSQVAPQGWRKLRDHLPLAGMYGIFIALLGLAAAAWDFAFNKVEARATFEANTGSTLASIDKRIGTMESSIAVLQARLVSQSLANAPQGELKLIAKNSAQFDPAWQAHKAKFPASGRPVSRSSPCCLKPVPPRLISLDSLTHPSRYMTT